MMEFILGNLYLFLPAALVGSFAAFNSRNAKYRKSKFPSLFPYILRHWRARPDTHHLYYSMISFVLFSTLWAASFSWSVYHIVTTVLQEAYDFLEIKKQSNAGLVTCTTITCLVYLAAFHKTEKELNEIVDRSANEQFRDSITRLHERINSCTEKDDKSILLQALTNNEGHIDAEQIQSLFNQSEITGGAKRSNALDKFLAVATILLTYVLRELRIAIYQRSDSLVQCFCTEIHGKIGHDTICHFLKFGNITAIQSLVDEVKSHIDIDDKTKNFQNARIALNIIVNHIGYFDTMTLLRDHVMSCDHTQTEFREDRQRPGRNPVEKKKIIKMYFRDSKSFRVKILEVSEDGKGIYVEWDRFIKSNNVVRLEDFNAASEMSHVSGDWVAKHSEAKIIHDRIVYGVGLQKVG